MQLLTTLAIAWLCTASGHEPRQEHAAERSPPSGWVDLRDAIPNVRVDARYHTADNFTGAPIPGYGVAGAWLHASPAKALAALQAELATQGLGLLIYDAYRPLRGTLGMVAWAHRTHQVALLDGGYIARRSNHNKGNTVDLTLIHLDTGLPLDMGTPWDTLSAASHTTKATGEALTHRLLLRGLMHKHGWKNYWREWWHYSFAMEGLTHRDVPYACFEPNEGAWTAPANWHESSFTPPSTWPADAPCDEAP
jgi:D-alanyl-D-alanine dipeptidase